MADSDRAFFTKLVADFKNEIIKYIDKGFTDQEKLFDAKLDPMGKSQDRLRNDIDDLYDKNRDSITDISELRTELNEHVKSHDKTGSNLKWVIGIIFMLLFSGAGLVISIVGLGG